MLLRPVRCDPDVAGGQAAVMLLESSGGMGRQVKSCVHGTPFAHSWDPTHCLCLCLPFLALLRGEGCKWVCLGEG